MTRGGLALVVLLTCQAALAAENWYDSPAAAALQTDTSAPCTIGESDVRRWKLVTLNDIPLLIPPSFKLLSQAPGGPAAARDGSLEFQVDFDFAHPFSETDFMEATQCIETVGHQRVLISKRAVEPQGYEVTAWPIMTTNDSGERDSAPIFTGRSSTDQDMAKFVTMVRTAVGPFRVRRHVARELADALPGESCDLSLRMFATRHRGSSHQVSRWMEDSLALLVNRGRRHIRLLRPAEGSAEGLRTPRQCLEVRHGRAAMRRERSEPRIDNLLEPPRTTDVMDLRPGDGFLVANRDSVRLDLEPGRYRMRMVYENDPDLRPAGSLGEVLPEAMKSVKDSTPCRVTSAWRSFEVSDERGR